MPTQFTVPPVITRQNYFKKENSPCYNHTDDYSMLLAYHRVGDSFFDTNVVDMVRAFMQSYPSNGVPVIVTKTYAEIYQYSNHDCTKQSLQFTLNAGNLDIEVIDEPWDKVISIYSVTLVKGIIESIRTTQPTVDTSKVEFEFTGGIAEYRIANDNPKTMESVLVGVSYKDNLGIKKYIGIYDVSIPPDNKRHTK